jgi:hypothetical protein
VNAEPSSLEIKSRHEGGTTWLGFGDRDTWRLTLPATPTLGLDLRLNAGRGTLDLAGARLAVVGLEMNAGSASLDLGNVAAISTIDMRLNAGSLGVTLPSLSLTDSIQANAGAVKICVPPGAGVRLHTGESIIAGYDYAGHGLVQDGSTWTTPGFDTAPGRSVRTVDGGPWTDSFATCTPETCSFGTCTLETLSAEIVTPCTDSLGTCTPCTLILETCTPGTDTACRPDTGNACACRQAGTWICF